MPQVLKDEVEASIRAAALEEFASRGYRAATVADIARRAGISAGNVYRYYDSKDALFRAVVPAALAERIVALVRARVAAARDAAVERSPLQSAPYRAVSAELLDLCIAHRLAVVVLLTHAEGTRFEGFADRLVAELARRAVAHFGVPRLAGPERLALDEIYRNLLHSLARILAGLADPGAIHAAVAAYTRYHLAGLAALLA